MTYRKIDTRIWNDAKFRTLNEDGKLAFFLLLTHPGMTSLGALPVHPAGLAHTLKWLPERFMEALAEPIAKGMVEVDEDEGMLCLPNFIRYNPPENPNVVKAWASSADMLPECAMKTRTLSRAYASLKGRSKSFEEAFVQRFGKQFGKPALNPMPNQEQEQEPSSALEERGGTYTHACAHEGETGEVPFDPPDNLDEAMAWVKRKGVPPENEARACSLLMNWGLTGSLLDELRGAA
ncbi:hypothetical protein [Ferirhizobium litorale]|uniref:Uncharacterized protein n=1 Tax=Ferirhizobium litorale TaxID=2927786 RepID=A0AAE3U2W8_9HYPH|nr:hypothetical protein [Fererhizobium litorale]MDI7921748.1 hypothetical protein [Fererhizobium litorale]